METEKYIYITREILPDNTIVDYYGDITLGIGETNLPPRRFREHISRGSKSISGLEELSHIKVDNISDRDIHKKILDLGFIRLKRHSIYEDSDIFNSTEVFSGRSKKTINGLIKKGDQLSVELIHELILINDPDVFKDELILKPHQKDAINFINERFTIGEDSVLLNHKPRSGKSFIMYDFLINNRFNIKNTLLLTQYPILNSQWERELKNIKGHNINVINCSELVPDDIIVIHQDKPNLVMMSLQDAKGNGKYPSDDEIIDFLNKQKFNELKNVEWDLVIFDEVHKGKETKKTDNLLNNLKYDKLIGLSATPTKNILRGTFKNENIHTYDLISERKYREKYGRSIYNLPDIRFNLMYCDDIKDELKYFEEEEYFTFKKFFRVDDGQLRYYDDIQLFFKWVFGIGGRFRDNALDNIIGRADIENILIFVETNECQELLIKCLEDIGGRFNNYNLYYTNSNVNNSRQLLNMIDEIDNIPGKSIIFANKQLTTGITLRKCDIVMFMNDWKSMDDYIQASYRCQSPSTTKMKRWTNVFDFNPSRSFNILYDYIRNSSIDKSYSFDECIREFLRCANVNLYENGIFKSIDFESFRDNIVKCFDFSDKKIFKNISSHVDLNQLSEDTKNDMLNIGNFNIGKSSSKNIKLNQDAEDSGKTHKEKDNEEKDKTSNNIDNSDNLIMDNIEYIFSKTPLLAYFTHCGYNSIDTIFDYLDNNSHLRNLYIDSLLLSSTDLNNDTIYKSIKKLYNSIDSIKNRLDDTILFFNKKYESILEKYLENNDILMYIKEVINLIDSYIGISESEKKLLGEVFTPFKLINEMLDTLPKEVWSNPHLKWLDPANGIGNFPIIIVERLMEGLKDFEPDYDKRYKHIMENMIYVCDINPKNMFIFFNLFNPDNRLNLNAYRGSFLDEGFDIVMKEVWGVEKFDIVVGNPPYNIGQNAKGKRGGGDTLWDKFVIKSLNDTLKNDGYLVFVHPTLWRKPQSEKSSSREVNNIMMKKQIHYLECHNSNDGMKTFNAGTRYDFYLLENCPIYKDTLINGEDRKNINIDLKKYDFIPNYNIELFDKLIDTEDDKRCPIIFNVSNYETRKDWVSSEKNDEFKYTLIHSTPKSGTRYMYSSRNDNGHFGIPKVIFGDSGIYDVIIDMNGKYGMTQHSMAIQVSSLEEAQNIKNVLMSENFSEFLKTVMWSNFQIDWRLFKYFKKDFWKEFI